MKNKPFIIALIIIFAVFALCLTGILVFAIRNGNNFNFTIGFSAKESDNLVEEKTYNNIDQVYIESDAANIYIKERASNEIKVLIYSKTNKNIKAESTNNNINITNKVKKCKGICFNNEISKIEVYLPVSYNGNLNIDNNYGDIKVGSFSNITLNINSGAGDTIVESAKEAYLNSSYGDININTLEKGKIKLSAGDLKIDKVNKIEAQNDYGDINIKRINEFLDINSDYGDVSLDDINLVSNSNIKLDFGDLNINRTNEIKIDAKTSLGDVKINNNYTNSNVSLKIENSLGDIKVNN